MPDTHKGGKYGMLKIEPFIKTHRKDNCHMILGTSIILHAGLSLRGTAVN